MRSKNEDSKVIKTYFLNLEKIVCLYLEYESEQILNKIYNNIKKSLNQKTKDSIVLNNIPNIKDSDQISFIYVMANYQGMSKSEYKIGYTDNIKKRLSTANVHFTDENKLFYMLTIACDFQVGNIKKFEDEIHSLLKDFNVNNEFFKLRFKYICKILKLIVLTKKKINSDTELQINEYINNLINSKLKYFTIEDEIKIFRNINNAKKNKINNSVFEYNTTIFNNIICNKIIIIHLVKKILLYL